jgi:hypothetical protein
MKGIPRFDIVLPPSGRAAESACPGNYHNFGLKILLNRESFNGAWAANVSTLRAHAARGRAAKFRGTLTGGRLILKFRGRLCYTPSHAKKEFSEQRHGGAGADDLRARTGSEHEEGDRAHH